MYVLAFHMYSFDVRVQLILFTIPYVHLQQGLVHHMFATPTSCWRQLVYYIEAMVGCLGQICLLQGISWS